MSDISIQVSRRSASPARGVPSSSPGDRRTMLAPADLVVDLQDRLGEAPAAEVLRLAVKELFPGRIAAVLSFGAESVDLSRLSRYLRIERGIASMLCEGGAHVYGAMIADSEKDFTGAIPA